MMNLQELKSKIWLEPWDSIEGEIEERELAMEVSPKHPLFEIEAVAVSRSGDDVLFFLPTHVPGFAVVHLTYNHKENSAIWPYTQFFDSFTEFEKQMLADHCLYLMLEREGNDDQI